LLNLKALSRKQGIYVATKIKILQSSWLETELDMFVNNLHANDGLLSRCFVPLYYLQLLLLFFTRETQVAVFYIFTGIYLGC